MSLYRKIALCLVFPATISAFTGCQQDTASNKKSGTYAAARHNSVGSNIPQRNGVDSTGASYDPNQFSNIQNEQSRLGAQGFQGGTR